MTSVRLKTTPRFWALVLLMVCIGTCISIACESHTLACQRAELDRLRQQKQELEYSNDQLRDKADFAQTDEFVVQQARMRGMIGQNETRYVLNAEEVLNYAQGGN